MVTLPSDMLSALRYYEALAPNSLPDPEPWPFPGPGGPNFKHFSLTYEDVLPYPAVSHVRLVDLTGDGRLELVVADMRHGLVMRARPYEADPAFEVIARVPHPASVQPVDLDGDGILDLLVADLGEMFPGDHEKGGVVWLRGHEDGTFSSHTLGHFPRVADVQAADLNGNGKLDLIVASFGWRKRGKIVVLENRTIEWDDPEFEIHVVDDRAGTIHVPPVDLNGDGRTDFVALISQEHEAVVAFINTDEPFQFRKEVIYTAPHPNWGSTGIQIVDLDGDGDLDVIMTNGDMFDDNLVKPYHGITWLENRGTFPFTAHHLAQLPGAHRALAMDLDQDGDLDIVAAAFTVLANEPEALPTASVVWLEQVKPGVFERRTLHRGLAQHATLDVGDINGNGYPDIVVGNFVGRRPNWNWVEVWKNVGETTIDTAWTRDNW